MDYDDRDSDLLRTLDAIREIHRETGAAVAELLSSFAHTARDDPPRRRRRRGCRGGRKKRAARLPSC